MSHQCDNDQYSGKTIYLEYLGFKTRWLEQARDLACWKVPKVWLEKGNNIYSMKRMHYTTDFNACNL